MSRKLDVVLAAICAHESGWGRSKLARERNNLAGMGAYGPGLGMAFESRADCIDYLARLLAGKPERWRKWAGGMRAIRGGPRRWRGA